MAQGSTAGPALDRLNQAAVPPAIRYLVDDALRLLPTSGHPLEGVPAERLARALVAGEPWLGAAPELAEIGYWMLDPRHADELRRSGCVWLTMFPSVDTATRLGALALDKATPPVVRDQAIWTLAYRQLRAMHPTTRWEPQAVQIADEALFKLADIATTEGAVTGKLPQALRHVQADAFAGVFARAPGMWADALECFVTPALARVLFVSIEDVAPQHRVRVLRLIAAALGPDAVPLLIARASAASIDERLEALFLALAIDGDAHVPRFEEALAGMKHADMLRARARWHLAHRGVRDAVPTVHALRTARVTATLPPDERVARCAAAADDFAVLSRFARYPEAYVYTLWGWMVRGAGDPERARALVGAHPESQRLVCDLFLEDLARRGRVRQLTAAAQALSAADRGALQLAIWGRPLAALELAATARQQTPELACARALACFRAGRPDLADRVLGEDLPPAEIAGTSHERFPGTHERWLVEHAPAHQPAVTALVTGRGAVISLARGAPHDAEPDTPSLEPIGAVERRLFRGLRGATVYFAGEFKLLDRDKLAAAVERAGARLVGGPFPGTDYYVHGDTCLVQTIAQLERQGTRRLRSGELEGL